MSKISEEAQYIKAKGIALFDSNVCRSDGKIYISKHSWEEVQLIGRVYEKIIFADSAINLAKHGAIV